MKNTLRFTIFPIIGIAIGYSMGAFSQASFNIAEWTEGSRISTNVLMLTLVFAGLIIADINKD